MILERISAEFGAVFIHCCGDFGRHGPALAELGPLLRKPVQPAELFELLQISLSG